MQEPGLRIADLLTIDGLATSLIAGATGRDRPVSWAHSCELDDPWEWLGRGELLMTMGHGLPADAEAQVRFVRRLAESALAGVMLGARVVDSGVSPEMLAEADRLGLPILRTEAAVPWSAVSRHVSAANQSPQTIEVLALAQLYELTAGTADPDAFAEGIARLFRIGIEVSEGPDGVRLFGSGPVPWAALNPDRERDRTHQVAGRHRLQIRVRERPDTRLSAMAVVHLKRVIEVEADRILLRAEERSHAEDRALRALLGEQDSGAAEQLLPGVDPGDGLLLLAVPSEALALFSRHAAVRQLPVLLGRHGGENLALVPVSQEGTIQQLAEQLGLPVGVSSVGHAWRDAAGLIPEAQSALQGLGGQPGWARYRGQRLGVLIRSDREAQLLVSEVFGPLAGGEPRHDTLRNTLFVYLRHERRWAESAAELGIHRQTLAYRLRSVESLTGRTLAKTEDLVALWLAAKAWARLHGSSLD